MSFIQNIIVYACSIVAVLATDITIGYMTIYVSAANQLFNTLQSFSQMYLDLFRTSAKVNKYIDFMQVSHKKRLSGDKTPQWDSDSIIEFKDVCFSYPGNDRSVINNFNFTIKYGEKIAIVGENGSGKSTFIKLLTRLYEPTKGKILLNGININEYDYCQYQKIFSPVFQDYYLYDLSIAENIALDDSFNQKQVEQACMASGLGSMFNKLPQGVNTQLGKNFDPEGVNLSGGEGQRLAIARAQYHNRPVFLLDEPTASLDPNAEEEIYTQFHQMITNKTAILITHRLSAVQLADFIAVFDNGEVIEYGTHKDLYAKGGKYCEMFDKQSKYYVEAAQHDSNSPE